MLSSGRLVAERRFGSARGKRRSGATGADLDVFSWSRSQAYCGHPRPAGSSHSLSAIGSTAYCLWVFLL
jgi:hypothetical protein